MKTTHRWQRSVLTILIALSIVACGVGGLFDVEPTPTTSPEKKDDPTDTQPPTSTLPPPEPTEPAPMIAELGAEFQSDEGGFTYRLIPGYTEEIYYSMVEMVAPDAAGESGPMVALMGGYNEEEMDRDELYDGFSAQLIDTEISKKSKTDIDGSEGYEIDIYRQLEDGETTGKLAIISVSPRQFFVLGAVAPPDRWDEIAPYYDALKAHITFFEPLVDAGNTSDPGGADGAPTFTMDEVEPGGFIFHINPISQDPTLVTEGSILDQSTSGEFAIGMSPSNMAYTVILFLPFDLSSGWIPMEPYDPDTENHAPGALLYVGLDTWYADHGDLYIDSFTDGVITISFNFYAITPDNLGDTFIEVTGVVKEFEMQSP